MVKEGSSWDSLRIPQGFLRDSPNGLHFPIEFFISKEGTMEGGSRVLGHFRIRGFLILTCS